MLPSLILLWAITAGSRRVSLSETPPLLDGGLPPAMKLLAAAFLLYSSSTSRLFRLRKNRKAPPAIAEIATIPTTTPTAMPVLLGPPGDDGDDGNDELEVCAFAVDPGAVTTIVCPPSVTTDGFTGVVAEGVVADVVELCTGPSALATLSVVPLR